VFGLASFYGVKVKKVYSAAAIVSRYFLKLGAQSFIAAFHIDGDRWLYVAQRGGLLLPDGDVLGSEDRVKSLFLTDLSNGGWDKIIGPDHWGLGGEVIDFRDIVPKNKKGKPTPPSWALLKPVNFEIPSLVFVAIGAVAVVGLAFGYFAYQRIQDEKRMAELRAQQQQKPPPPWERKFYAQSFLYHCDLGLAKLEFIVPGWSTEQISCEGGSVSAQWRRLSDGQRSAMESIFPAAHLDVPGDVATYQAPLGRVVMVQDKMIRGNIVDFVRSFLDAFQSSNVFPAMTGVQDGSQVAPFEIKTWMDPEMVAYIISTTKAKSNVSIDSVILKKEKDGGDVLAISREYI